MNVTHRSIDSTMMYVFARHVRITQPLIQKAINFASMGHATKDNSLLFQIRSILPVNVLMIVAISLQILVQ